MKPCVRVYKKPKPNSVHIVRFEFESRSKFKKPKEGKKSC